MVCRSRFIAPNTHQPKVGKGGHFVGGGSGEDAAPCLGTSNGDACVARGWGRGNYHTPPTGDLTLMGTLRRLLMLIPVFPGDLEAATKEA